MQGADLSERSVHLIHGALDLLAAAGVELKVRLGHAYPPAGLLELLLELNQVPGGLCRIETWRRKGLLSGDQPEARADQVDFAFELDVAILEADGHAAELGPERAVLRGVQSDQSLHSSCDVLGKIPGHLAR